MSKKAISKLIPTELFPLYPFKPLRLFFRDSNKCGKTTHKKERENPR